MGNQGKKKDGVVVVEAARNAKPLCDVLPVRLQLTESGEGGKLVVRGEFARGDKPTENKRTYPTKLWTREIGKLEKMMGERKLFGELDHPADGKTMLARVSHLITNMSVDENGVVIGEAEILDTRRGEDLKAILKANASVGVSSRGYGSTAKNEDGVEIVQDDYTLVTFDFVAEPADSSAYPEVSQESKVPETTQPAAKTEEEPEKDSDEDPDKKTDACECGDDQENAMPPTEESRKVLEAQLEEARKDERAKTEERMKDEFSKRLVEEVTKVKEEAAEKVVAELLTDPNVAGAKTALEKVREVLRPYVLPEDVQTVVTTKDKEISELKIALTEKDARIKSLEEEVDKIAQVAKEVGYKFFLERLIGNDKDADLIRRLVGDVTRYSKADDIKLKVEAVRKEMAKTREKALKEDQQRKRELERIAEAEKASQDKIDKLTEALEKSLELNKELGLKLYAEKKLTHNPRASKIRSVVEAASVSSKKDIDQLIESFADPLSSSSAEDADTVRARVRRLTGGGFGATPKDEETPTPRKASALVEETDYNGLGLPLGEIKTLSGLAAENGSKKR